MKPKRRNLTRWQEARLRRLDAKIAKPCIYGVGDSSPESLNRCRDRAGELANAIQIAWGKRNADKIRADLSGQPR